MNMFKPTKAKTPEEYLSMIDEPRQSEVRKLYDFINKTLPKEKPFILYGMIGWVPFHYKYKSGREGDWSVMALASQKNYISLYACAIKDGQYIAERHKDELTKASIGRSCIRIKKADDIDPKVLKKIILESVENKDNYGV